MAWHLSTGVGGRSPHLGASPRGQVLAYLITGSPGLNQVLIICAHFLSSRGRSICTPWTRFESCIPSSCSPHSPEEALGCLFYTGNILSMRRQDVGRLEWRSASERRHQQSWTWKVGFGLRPARRALQAWRAARVDVHGQELEASVAESKRKGDFRHPTEDFFLGPRGDGVFLECFLSLFVSGMVPCH